MMTTLDKWRMLIGGGLVFGLVIMAVLFALGDVTEQTSFGLTQVITIISTIALGWAQWAFPHARSVFFPGEQEAAKAPKTNGQPGPAQPPAQAPADETKAA